MGRKSRQKVKKSMQTRFMNDLIQYATDIYSVTTEPTKGTDQNVRSKRTPSPFCIHIGEAVIALSYVNRLNFKLRFDENYDFIERNTNNLNEFVTYFCEEIYVEGYFDQFFIVYGFAIDLLIYLTARKRHSTHYYLSHMVELFDAIFIAILKDKFLKRGGWVELKRKARPWSHTFRDLSQDPAFSLGFRHPGLVLFNTNYTRELLSRYSIEIKSYEGYPDRTYHEDLKEAYPGQFLELEKRMEELTPEQQACSLDSCKMFCLRKAISNKGTQSFSKVQRDNKQLQVASSNATLTSAPQDLSGNTSQKSRGNRKKSPRKDISPGYTSQTSSALPAASICDSETTTISLDLDSTLTDTSWTSSVSEDSTRTSQTDTSQTFSASVDVYQTALGDLSHKCRVSENIPEIISTDISVPLSLSQNILQPETVDDSQTFSVFSELSPAAVADTPPKFIVCDIRETTAADISQKDLVPEAITQTSSAETLHTCLAFEGIPQTSLPGTSKRFVASEDILETASDDTSRAFSVPKDIPQTLSAATFQKFSPSTDISQSEFSDTSRRCRATKDILTAASTQAVSIAFSEPTNIPQTEASGTSQTFSVFSELQTALAGTSQMLSEYSSSGTASADNSPRSPAAENAPQTSFTDNCQKFTASENILKTKSADDSPVFSRPKDIFQTETDDSKAFSLVAELPQTALTNTSQPFEALQNVLEATPNDTSVSFSVPECIPQNSNSEIMVDQVATESPEMNSALLLEKLDFCEELGCSLISKLSDPSSKSKKTPEITEKDESCDEITDTSPCREMEQFFRTTMKEVKQELSKRRKS